MHILISNDDGVQARGLAELVEAVRSLGRVTVVAPDAPRSGAANQITTNMPLRLQLVRKEEGLEIYKCSGTPTDCVKVALHALFRDQKPDLLLSGINHGRNDGVCVFYSGTIGAAIEGAIAGVPAIAFSRNLHNDGGSFEHCTTFARDIVRQITQTPLPAKTLLSVNFPYDGTKGVKWVRQATGRYTNEYFESSDAAGNTVYWMQGDQSDPEQRTDTDLYWLEQGYTTVTPIQLDLTDYSYLNTLQRDKLFV